MTFPFMGFNGIGGYSPYGAMGMPSMGTFRNSPLVALQAGQYLAPMDPTGGMLANMFTQVAMMDAMQKQMYSGGMNPYLAQAMGGYNPYGGASMGGGQSILPQILTAALLKTVAETGGLGGEDGEYDFDSLIANEKIGTVKNGMKEYDAIDANEDKSVDFDEYLDYYIAQREDALGRDLKKKEVAYYREEATNLFEAMAKDGVITRDRFNSMLTYFDRRDGEKDGKIKGSFYARAIDKIKEEGADAKISRGKTLGELIG